MSDNNVTWVPVIDSRGFDRDQDGNVYAYCRAVASPTWSQEPPTVAGDWWMWHVGNRHVQYVRVSRVAGTDDYMAVAGDGMTYLVHKADSFPTRYWMPATVPQPPGEVGP